MKATSTIYFLNISTTSRKLGELYIPLLIKLTTNPTPSTHSVLSNPADIANSFCNVFTNVGPQTIKSNTPISTRLYTVSKQPET